jgi:DNA-binding response OmpR family regulator
LVRWKHAEKYKLACVFRVLIIAIVKVQYCHMDNATDQNSTPELNGKKILCIEDERFISELYARALGKNGYDVTIEPDGQKGLELALTDEFDIILLDLMIPTITGFEVLEKIRTHAGSPIRAKIIITTNLDQREEVRQKIEEQADAYLVKAEITPRELVEFLSHVDMSSN